MARTPDAVRLERRRAFGLRVRELRAERGHSQEGFAALVGIHRTYIGSVERGERNISLDNIHAIADALGVPARVLISDD